LHRTSVHRRSKPANAVQKQAEQTRPRRRLLKLTLALF
jgi:hypothetical protein